MVGLVTDRTQSNVHYRKMLSDKGWSNMTETEKAEWLGDPLVTVGANLFASSPNYSETVDLKYRSEEIVATALTGGTYLFGVSIIGNASDFEDTVLTLSCDDMTSTVGGHELSVWWHDETGYNFAGASLSVAGSVTFDTSEWKNTSNRKYLAVYVYVGRDIPVEPGETAKFSHVMLTKGSTKYEYKPYVEIIPTLATKGAYNYSDLNRVERAVAEISDLMGLNLVTKTDWGVWDVPTESEMGRYIRNIEAIHNLLPDDDNTPPVPTSMSKLTFEGANNIELILLAAYSLARS